MLACCSENPPVPSFVLKALPAGRVPRVDQPGWFAVTHCAKHPSMGSRGTRATPGGNSYTRSFPTRGKQGGKGRRAAKWFKCDTTAGCCAFGTLTFLFFLRSSYTSDEASLATDLLVLCHGGHLPPPSGHWDREQNLSGFFCSIQ